MSNVYEKLYDGKEYREFSPGEQRLPDFFRHVQLGSNDVVIDFGCGTGRAAASIAKRCKVIGVDFAANALETDIEFHKHDLRRPLDISGTKGFCTDVMEHIGRRDVQKVLRNIMSAVDECYFQICTVDDAFGKTVGEPLHLTVKPFWWWAKQLDRYGLVRYARQEQQHAIFVVKRSLTLQQIEKKIELTEDKEIIKANIIANIKAEWQEAPAHEAQSKIISLLAGGPSLKDFDGQDPIITVNGAYNWAIEHGYKPQAQIIVDAREFNKRFLQPVIPGCKYLLSSSCHPSLFESVPRDQIWMWHSVDWLSEVLDDIPFKERNAVFGGSSVMLRALPLLCMLGLRRFSIWGWDSCIMNDEHHAYPQPENDNEKILDLIVAGRKFKCQAGQAFQAQEFITLIRHMLPDDAEMIVHGNGLISHILNTGMEYANGS